MKRKNRVFTYSLISIIVVVGILCVLPILITLVRSIYMDDKVTFIGYAELLLNCFPFYRYFWNSIAYGIVVTGFGLIINIGAAFGLKFSKFKGKNFIYLLYIILMMMPLQVMILPNYIGLREMNILNTPLAIILPALFQPLGAVVIHQYLKEMNMEMIESARLETNSVLVVIVRVVAPQVKVCLVAVSLLIFADAWNMVEQPLLYVNDDRLRMLSNFITQSQLYDNKVLLPASVFFIIPVAFCYGYFHNELEQGLKIT